jgi:hypothetical protein
VLDDASVLNHRKAACDWSCRAGRPKRRTHRAGRGRRPSERDDFSSNRHRALRYWWSMIFSENRHPLFGIMLYWWSMIFSENRYPLFGIMLYWWSMIFSENRYPLFGIML